MRETFFKPKKMIPKDQLLENEDYDDQCDDLDSDLNDRDFNNTRSSNLNRPFSSRKQIQKPN